MMNQRLFFCIRFFALCGVVSMGVTSANGQQRTQYTQYMFSGLVINPAYAGADDALSATFIDRHQWVGVDGAPSTQTLTLHGLNSKKRVGLGLTISNDKIGIHQNLTAQASYAYHLNVAAKSVLSFGLQGGVFHVRSDYGSLVSSGTPDPKLNGVRINELFFDMGAGIYFRSPRLQAGISAPELLTKSSSINDTTSISLKSTNLLGFLKYRFALSPTWSMEPAVLLKYFHNVPVSVDASLLFVYKNVLAGGASYRRNESIACLLKINVTRQLQLGYAYDSPLRQTSGLSNGSHELMVQYLFRFERSGIKSPRI
jgi:type IX secretion system PorP/SprF family membrane protein